MRTLTALGLVATLALAACGNNAATTPAKKKTELSLYNDKGAWSKYFEDMGALSKQQISAANGDAFGVFLVGVPIGSVAGGDKEGEMAASKGKVSAMQSAGMSKGCKLPG